MPRAAEYLRRISEEMVAVQRPVRILKAINWDPSVHEQFFRRGARELPRPEYAPLGYDATAKIAELGQLQRRIRGRNPVEKLLREKCAEFALVVRLLQARGTRRFFELSRMLYGEPRRAPGRGADDLTTARKWAARPLAREEEPGIAAEEAALQVKAICDPHLGGEVKVLVRRRLTANAASGATRVTLKKGVLFTARQVRALAHHEGLWHVLTSLNGFSQPVLTVLGVGLPRHTESQEGGGVVSELLTGNISDTRFVELGERTICVDMAARGADYLEVFRHLTLKFPPAKAAQICERVFRGGLVTGGAPFTKDAAYQRGYCRTLDFLRTALARKDVGLVRAFLAGKMNVDDAELVRNLIEEGICSEPAHLPAWFGEVEVIAAPAMLRSALP